MVGQVCLAAGRGEEHLRHRQLPAAEHRRRSWCAPSNGLLTTVCYQFGDGAAGLRAGGLDRGHRLGRAVAARPARHHQRRQRERERWPARSTDNGGVYFVPGVLRPVRAVLALRRPRRDRRAVPLQHQRPPGPGHARGDLLPEPRRGRGDGEGLRRPPRGAQGRRRRHRQRPVHADPGRRPRRRRSAARWSPRRPRSARPTPPAWPPASGQDPEELRAELAGGPALGAGRRARSSATPATPAGTRRSSAPWTGWTSRDPRTGTPYRLDPGRDSARPPAPPLEHRP